MKYPINLLVAIALLCTFAIAHAELRALPAKPTEFEGIWKLLPIDPSLGSSTLKDDPWPAKCQYFGHYSHGTWLHQQTHLGECKNGIPSKPVKFPKNATWRIPKDGLLIIERPDLNLRELWKVDRIVGAAHLGTTNLNEGDLIMQMFSPENRDGFVYARLLRRVK